MLDINSRRCPLKTGWFQIPVCMTNIQSITLFWIENRRFGASSLLILASATWPQTVKPAWPRRVSKLGGGDQRKTPVASKTWRHIPNYVKPWILEILKKIKSLMSLNDNEEIPQTSLKLARIDRDWWKFVWAFKNRRIWVRSLAKEANRRVLGVGLA